MNRNENVHGVPLDFDGGVISLTEQHNDNGSGLLRETEALFDEYLSLPKGGGLVLALFSIATHCFKSFDQFPYLVLLSPTKGCGKTRVTEVLEGPAANVIRTAGMSEAVLFRLVETQEPTLVIDEAEPLTGKSERAESLRSLLNSGNRADALVYRCAGPNHDVKGFRIFCPKIFCAIRVCPDTVKDRAIVFSMQKKLPSQTVRRFLSLHFKPTGMVIRERIAAWIGSRAKEIRCAYEKLELDFLPDRDAENWQPLFAVLEVLAPERENELRSIAERLSGQKTSEDEDDTLNLRLLADIRDVRQPEESVVSSADLLQRLTGLEDSPWHKEIPLDTRKLARMLRPFVIAPRTVRAGEKVGKGYIWELLEPAFLRYLAPRTEQALQINVYAGQTHFSDPLQEPFVTDEKSEESSMFMRVVTDVTDQGPDREGSRVAGKPNGKGSGANGNHGEERLECLDCGKEFDTRIGLAAHVGRRECFEGVAHA